MMLQVSWEFVTKNNTGLIEMKQTGLIDHFIETLGIDSSMSTSKWTSD